MAVEPRLDRLTGNKFDHDEQTYDQNIIDHPGSTAKARLPETPRR